jgi:hypothetical protein
MKMKKRIVSAETRRKLSEALKRAWRLRQRGTNEEVGESDGLRSEREKLELRRTPITTNIHGSNALTNCVRYVPDDEVTAKVEILRGIIGHDELIHALGTLAHNRIDAAVGAS